MERKLVPSIVLSSVEDLPVSTGSKIHCSHDKDTKHNRVQTWQEPTFQSSSTVAFHGPPCREERALAFAHSAKPTYVAPENSPAPLPKKKLELTSRSIVQAEEVAFPNSPWPKPKLTPGLDDKFMNELEWCAALTIGPEWRTFLICNFESVTELLSTLVCEYSKPSFQCELQRLLISSRKTSQHASASQKIVLGRCELCRSTEEEVLTRMNIAKGSTTSVWKAVAVFAHDETVVASLSIVDELLALPPNSTLKALLDLGEHSLC